MASESAMPRSENTPDNDAPGTGSVRGSEPVAMPSRSYGSAVPSDSSTTLRTRSIARTRVSGRSVIFRRSMAAGPRRESAPTAPPSASHFFESGGR